MRTWLVLARRSESGERRWGLDGGAHEALGKGGARSLRGTSLRRLASGPSRTLPMTKTRVPNGGVYPAMIGHPVV